MSHVNRPIILRTLLFLFWLVLYGWGTYHHVFWRDEVRALSIAQSASTIDGLFQLLTNEGHPPLWYLLLYAMDQIFHSNWVLPFLAGLFAIFNAGFISLKSPFHWSVIALILLGNYVLYEYSMVARNYGLAASFFMLFAFYARKLRYSIAMFFLCLASLANFYALVFAVILAMFLSIERMKSVKDQKWRVLIPIFFLCFCALIGIYFILPTNESLVVQPFEWSQIKWSEIWDVGWGFDHLFNGVHSFKHGFKTWMLILMSFIFWRKWKWMICLYLGMLFMSAFHLSIRPNFSHHEGMFYFFIISILWWRWDDVKEQLISSTWAPKMGYLSFLALLTINLIRGVRTFEIYTNLDQSNANHMGWWLINSAQKNAVVLAEPDYTFESVMYYYPKPYFILRENKLGTYAMFTRANKNELTLLQLLQKENQFNMEETPAYIITKWDLLKTQDTIYRHSYDKEFIVDSVTYKLFNEQFQLDTSFTEFIGKDEYYYVYSRK